jgi:hypothetical protein
VEDHYVFSLLPLAERRALVSKVVPAGDIWKNDPSALEAVRHEAAAAVIRREGGLKNGGLKTDDRKVKVTGLTQNL